MPYGYFETTPPDDNDILLGEGVYIKNFGSDDEIMGATRENSKVEIERVLRDLPFDGAYGPYFDLKRYETYEPRFVINFLKINYVTLSYGTSTTVTETSTYREIAFRLNIEDADYIDNIAFVGKKHDGKQCIIILENVLNDGNIVFEYKEKDEVINEMTYTSHYLRTALTTPTIKIREYDIVA